MKIGYLEDCKIDFYMMDEILLMHREKRAVPINKISDVDNSFDGVVIDVHNNIMDGFSFAEAIRENGYENAIIMISGVEPRPDMKPKVKADMFIVKPITENSFRVMRSTIRRKQYVSKS